MGSSAAGGATPLPWALGFYTAEWGEGTHRAVRGVFFFSEPGHPYVDTPSHLGLPGWLQSLIIGEVRS